MRLAAAFAAMALAAGPGLLAREPAPLTRTSVGEMTPQALSRRLFGDLSGIMFRIPRFGRLVDRPNEPLQWLHFLTRPYTTEDGGVCGTTHLTVYFQPVGARHGARTAVRPWRIFTEQNFFLLDHARLRNREPIADPERPRLENACAAQDPRNTRWFTAPGSSEVAEVARRFADLVEAARRGRSTAPLDCTPLASFGNPPVDEAECVRRIAHLDPAKIWEVRACDDRPCVSAVVDGGYIVSFNLRPGDAAPVRITVEPNIIVTG
jgi:hypothetical protein